MLSILKLFSRLGMPPITEVAAKLGIGEEILLKCMAVSGKAVPDGGSDRRMEDVPAALVWVTAITFYAGRRRQVDWITVGLACTAKIDKSVVVALREPSGTPAYVMQRQLGGGYSL